MNREIAQTVIDCIDKAMPGRRVGSVPPKDWTAEASAEVARLYEHLPKGPFDSLGMSKVRAFCAAYGLHTDDGYVTTFRTIALKRRIREESATMMQNKTV